jgi:phosphatidylglycerophosphatase A
MQSARQDGIILHKPLKPPVPTFNPRRIEHWLVFGFGSGLAPKAPGTWGTLAAVPLYWLMAPLDLATYLALTGILLALGIWLCGRVGRELGVHDHPAIVWDEVVGYLITMTAVAPGILPTVLGFVLFRLFDILKPWPVSYFDRQVGGGWGVMLDDVVAGLMALAVLQLLLHYVF